MKKRANGQGGITFDTARGTYRASITDPEGRRIHRRFPTAEQAEAWLADIRSAIYKGIYVPPSGITVGEWVSQYIEVYCKPNVRFKTYIGYVQISKHLRPIAETLLHKLTAHQVQLFYSTLTVSDSYKHQVHRLLKAAVTKAAMTDVVPKNIMLAVEAPKLKAKRVEIFSKDELEKILAYLKNSRCDRRRMYPIVALALETGARMGEILGLKIADVKDGAINISASVSDVLGKPTEQPPKTEAGRRVISVAPPLEQLLRQVIAAHKFDGTPTAYLFSTASGRPLSTHNVEMSWRRILDRAGVAYKKFHTLRHTNASMLLAGSVPLLEVAHRLGHSKAAHTLNLYGHAVPGKDKEVAEIAGRIFATSS